MYYASPSAVPLPTVSVHRYPNDSTLYTAMQVDFTCVVELTSASAIDTGITVSTTWNGPNGALASNGRVTIYSPMLIDDHYESLLGITSLRTSDAGAYTCATVLTPNPPSNYIRTNSSSNYSNISVGKYGTSTEKCPDGMITVLCAMLQ